MSENALPISVKVEVVGSVVLSQNGKILLVQEKQPAAYGKWNFPGGKVDAGETTEAAAIREAKEETGFDVELDRALAVHHESAQLPVLHSFAAHITGGELHFPQMSYFDAQWFTPAEIQAMAANCRSPQFIFASLQALETDS